MGATATGWIEAGWAWLIGHIAPVLGWAAFLVPSFAKYPFTGLVALALLAFVFFVWSNRLQQRIEVHAEWAWARQKGLPATARPNTSWYNTVARRLRPITAWLYTWVWRMVFVNLLGIVLGLLALIPFLLIWISRVFRRRPWMA